MYLDINIQFQICDFWLSNVQYDYPKLCGRQQHVYHKNAHLFRLNKTIRRL